MAHPVIRSPFGKFHFGHSFWLDPLNRFIRFRFDYERAVTGFQWLHELENLLERSLIECTSRMRHVMKIVVPIKTYKQRTKVRTCAVSFCIYMHNAFRTLK